MSGDFQPDPRVGRKIPPLTIRKLKKEYVPEGWEKSTGAEKTTKLYKIVPDQYHDKIESKGVDACINDTLHQQNKYRLDIFTYIGVTDPELLRTVAEFGREMLSQKPKIVKDDAGEGQSDEGDDEINDEVRRELLETIAPFNMYSNEKLWKRNVDIVFTFFRRINNEPEMFIMTSGNARFLFPDDIVDDYFPRSVARRILDFNLKSSSFGHLTGPDKSTFTRHNLGEVRDLSLLDAIGRIVKSFEMPVRRNCSLYEVETLKDKRGKEAVVNVTVGGRFKTLQIKKKLSLNDIQEILHRFSRISEGELTRLTTGENEEDNLMFDVFENIQNVTDKELCGKLDQELHCFLESRESTSFNLSHRFQSTWQEANTFKLKHRTRPGSYTTINQWEGDPPSVAQVIDAVKNVPGNFVDKFNQMFLEFICSIRESGVRRYRFPVVDFIEGNLKLEGKVYFRYEGKWLQIRNQYWEEVEKQVHVLINEQHIQPDVILPLLWRQTPNDIKEKKRDQMVRKCKYDIKDLHLWGGQSDANDTGTETVDFRNFSAPNPKKLLFKRMHSHQSEALYNEGYILYNRLTHTADGSRGYLVGDRILIKDCTIELFDILYYTPKETYLIHVKEGFGHSSRDVCSQIRVSADFVFNEIITGKQGKDILEELWTVATTDAQSAYTEANKSAYEKLTQKKFFDLFRGDRGITYILAYRDTHERSQLSRYSDLFPEGRFMEEQCLAADFDNVKAVLKNTGYLLETKNKLFITNKIFMTEAGAVKQMTEAGPEHLDETQAKRAFSILRETVCLPPSVITKMELVHLFQYFKKFQITGRKMTLKICSLNKVLDWE